MITQPRGLRPHTHEQRKAVIEQLIPLWQEKFGDNLLAVSAAASYARQTDRSYSDLELGVFLKEPVPEGEDRYLQRVVDGMLIEAIYYTPQQYIKEVTELGKDWYLAASDVNVGVYNPAFVEDLVRQARAVQHSEEAYLHAAARFRYELQEGFGKVLNAVEQGNVEGISLLLADAVLFLMRMLATLNQRPLTTFARFIQETRAMPVKPERTDELLDILVQGSYQNLPHVGEVAMAVFADVERIFAQRGIALYDDPLDPRLQNQKYISG